MSKKVTFEESLDTTDWGLIVDKDGTLKGLFIPDGADENDVPQNIIDICVQNFDIDPDEFYGDDSAQHPAMLH